MLDFINISLISKININLEKNVFQIISIEK